MQSRRQFVKNASLISLAPAVPLFIPRSLSAKSRNQERILVVIELAGGNDGVNTVVPFRDPGYAKHRSRLRLPRKQLLQLNDELGFHPAMRELADTWQKGQLAVVQGVGYPNPNRSHFRSMEIWHSGVVASEHYRLGWLGKAFDAIAQSNRDSIGLSVGQQSTPQALRGKRTIASSIQRLEQYDIADGPSRFLRKMAEHHTAVPEDDVLHFVRRTQTTMLQTIEDIKSVTDRQRAGRSYPSTGLGQQLRLVSRLLRAGASSRVFYTQQAGYDTHSGQLPAHNSLLRDLSGSVGTFLEDLQGTGLGERVVVMAFSEFGRRVRENGTDGTDHGTAGPVFLAGPSVAGGVHGKTPSLTQLVKGDLKMAVDFRSVYSTVLQDWLNLSPLEAIGAGFPTMPLIRKV